MFSPVATQNPSAVEAEVQAAYLAMFPQGDRQFVPRIFGWALDYFDGKYADYLPIDARYHNLEHTLQGILCMARILQGRQMLNIQPVLSQRIVELGLLAMLLHDTGYLKKRNDTEGTGAKYTVVHVMRSVDFAGQFMAAKGFPPREISAVQHMIRCTGVDALIATIPFQSEEEKIVGFILGSADLIGQMAAPDYVDKLPVLYQEFSEASRFSPQKNTMVNMFASAKDLLYKTPGFWDNYVKVKLDRDFGGQHRCLSRPYPNGANQYIEQVEANIKRLRDLIASESNTIQFMKNFATA